MNVPDMSSTHRNVVIGVTLLAILALFSVFFWIGIGFAAAITPEDGVELVTVGDYLALPRLLVGILTGVLGTAVAWMIADNLIE